MSNKLRRSLRKHAFSNILKILLPKNENFQIKKYWYFHISTQNIDCWYSLEPPRLTHNLCFWAETRKIMYSLVNPSFFYIKVGFKGSKFYRRVFVMYFMTGDPRKTQISLHNLNLSSGPSVHWYIPYYLIIYETEPWRPWLYSNFSGSNIFWTMEIRSRQG